MSPSDSNPLAADPAGIADANLVLRANNDAVEIRVLDASFDTVAVESGSLTTAVPAGLYQIRYRAGPLVSEKLIRLHPGETFEDRVELELPSPTPLVGTSNDSPRQREVVARLSSSPSVASAGSGEFMLFMRRLSGQIPDVDHTALYPFALLDAAGALVFDFDQGVEEDSEGHNWVATSLRLPPGGYTLRYPEFGQVTGDDLGVIDQSLWVADGWRTLIFIPLRRKGPEPQLASVHIVRIGAPSSVDLPETSRVALALETALAALRRGQRAIYREHRNLLLEEKFNNPMLGIVGAHAILLSAKPEWDLFDEVVQHLGALIPDHPDVTALRLIGTERRHRGIDRPLLSGTSADEAPSELAGGNFPVTAWPPMMSESYRALLRCDALWPGVELIAPDSVAERAASRVLLLGTWTTWRPLDSAIPDYWYGGDVGLLEQSNFVRQQAQKLAGWVLDRFGKGVAGRDWQRFVKGARINDPAMYKVRRYLDELVQTSNTPNAQEFVKELDVAHLSAAIGLPVRTVRAIRDELSTSLASRAKDE